MLVHLKDNVQRLVTQAEHADRANAPTFLRLLEQRRDWIKGEMSVEAMLKEPPRAPLGIQDNIYDLASLTIDPIDDHRRAYERMIETIDHTMSSLWERMLTTDEAAE
jgi:hypothetical protein